MWFEYRNGYEFLEEEEDKKKNTVSVQSFSTSTASAQNPAPKRRRPEETDEEMGQEDSPAKHRIQQQSRSRLRNNKNRRNEEAGIVTNDEVGKKLYSTPATNRRQLNGEILVNMATESPIEGEMEETEREVLTQITQ